MHYRRKLIEFLMENSILKIEPHTWSLLEISCIFEPILEHFRSILKIEGIFGAFWGLFGSIFWRESVWLFLLFRNRVANLVSVSNLVINCTELPFERYIFKWSQLSFLLSFSIGNSKFNPKGDIILFVVCGDIQVQEKLFKILILPKVTIQKLIPLCCQKLRFQRWCNNIQLFHFPSLHRNPKVTIKSWFPYAAVQYSWWPMANNSKVDSSVLPKATILRVMQNTQLLISHRCIAIRYF